MNATAKVLVKSVNEKLSQRGEKYYQCDLVEDTGIPTGTGVNHKRVWEGVYMPHTLNTDNPKALEGYEVPVTMNFYPVTRQVGDKSYVDIKCNIVKFN